MGATIDVDVSPDGGASETPDSTQVVVANEMPTLAEPSTCATQNSKKPPFPGDFIDNRNG